MSNPLFKIKRFLAERFTLNEDKADENEIIETIKRDVNFKGTNLWTLIFAIFIASIGLNVNSTAVIIGAMLISPLMGPIMGIGLSIGINDFNLLKTAAKNLLIAAVISIATSSLYFLITPLHDASSELLARTNPSIWDVFIAFFGGLAGIVAGTRKQKSNVIPGVAIATALMPPLCTAGFGLATGQLYYFLGALYLFFINSLFICLAAFLIVKHLRFHKKQFPTPETEKKVSRYIFLVVVLTIIPSVYLAYRIVQRSIFENNAKKYVLEEFHFSRTQVVTRNFIFDSKNQTVELLLVGQPLSKEKIDTLKGLMPKYKLTNTKLVVHQGLDAKQKIDLAEIKASILEEAFGSQTRDSGQHTTEVIQEAYPEIGKELKSLYPSMKNYSLQITVLKNLDSNRRDTLTLFTAEFSKAPSKREKTILGSWLKQRIKTDSLRLILEQVR